MIDLLTSFINTVSALVNFIISSISSLIQLITLLPTYISYLTVSIGFLPSILIPFAIATISVYVVFLIIDR